MDPQATLTALMDAIENKETEEAIEHARNLEKWLNSNGFPPTIKPHELSFLMGTLADLLIWKRDTH